MMGLLDENEKNPGILSRVGQWMMKKGEDDPNDFNDIKGMSNVGFWLTGIGDALAGAGAGSLGRPFTPRLQQMRDHQQAVEMQSQRMGVQQRQMDLHQQRLDMQDPMYGFNQYQQMNPEEQQAYGEFASMNVRPHRVPAAIQEYQFLQTLEPEQQELYFRNKRAQQMFKHGDVNMINDPVNGPRTAIPTKPGLSLEQGIANQQEELTRVNADKKAKEFHAVDDAKDIEEFESKVANANDSIAQLERIMAMPGFDGSVGLFDQGGAWFSTMTGGESGKVRQNLQSWIEGNVLSESASLAGVLSDADLAMLRRTAPGMSAHEDVWRDWVANTLKPKVAMAQARLSKLKGESAATQQPATTQEQEITLPNGLKVKRVN